MTLAPQNGALRYCGNLTKLHVSASVFAGEQSFFPIVQPKGKGTAMCGLNQLFCTTLIAAKMADGSIKDLLNCEGGHHAFVEGKSDVFPEISMRHLVDVGLTTEAEYRMLAIGERVRHLTQDYGAARPSDQDYIDGKVHTLVRDQYVSEGLWNAKVAPVVKRRRARAAIHRLANAESRANVLSELDAYLEPVDLNDVGGYYAYHSGNPFKFTEAENAFIRGCDVEIFVGAGRTSRSYADILLKQRLDHLINTLRSPTHQLTPRPEFATFAKIFPSEWTAFEEGLAIWQQSIGNMKKRRHRKQCFRLHVAAQAQAVIRQLLENRQQVVDAMWDVGMIRVQRTVLHMSEPVQALAA